MTDKQKQDKVRGLFRTRDKVEQQEEDKYQEKLEKEVGLFSNGIDVKKLVKGFLQSKQTSANSSKCSSHPIVNPQKEKDESSSRILAENVKNLAALLTEVNSIVKTFKSNLEDIPNSEDDANLDGNDDLSTRRHQTAKQKSIDSPSTPRGRRQRQKPSKISVHQDIALPHVSNAEQSEDVPSSICVKNRSSQGNHRASYSQSAPTRKRQNPLNSMTTKINHIILQP